MIYIYDSEIKQIGHITEVSDFKFVDKDNDVGSFSFKTEFTTENYNLLQPRHFINVSNPFNESIAGFIETISVYESKNIISVSGSSLNGIMSIRPYIERIISGGEHEPILDGEWVYGSTVPGGNVCNTIFSSSNILTHIENYANTLRSQTGFPIYGEGGVGYMTGTRRFPLGELTLLDILRDLGRNDIPNSRVASRITSSRVYIGVYDREEKTIATSNPHVDNIVYTLSTKGEIDSVWGTYGGEALTFTPIHLITSTATVPFRRVGKQNPGALDRVKGMVYDVSIDRSVEDIEDYVEKDTTLFNNIQGYMDMQARMDLRKSETSFEFTVDSTVNLPNGCIVHVIDPKLNITIDKIVSEIEYIMIGQDIQRIYKFSDYRG